jgi:hypothetical protein
MEISTWMMGKILRGEAILFLGAGASFGARSADGTSPISGGQLRDMIADEFLGGEQKDQPLTTVGEYAKYQSSLPEVQAFIKDQFKNLTPSDFHLLIPTFKWHSIFTTNYDLIIERAYDSVTERMQDLSPIIRDGDQFTSAIGETL